MADEYLDGIMNRSSLEEANRPALNIDPPRGCSCHPDDKKAYGIDVCPRKQATTDCRIASLEARLAALRSRPSAVVATHAMALAGARSIGNTIHTDNHMVRARSCWDAMWAARDGIVEPIPQGNVPPERDTPREEARGPDVDPREYCKIRYSAPSQACKCGNCQLVPPEQLVIWSDTIERLDASNESNADHAKLANANLKQCMATIEANKSEIERLSNQLEKAISLNVDLQDQLNATKRSLAHSVASRAKEAGQLEKTQSALRECRTSYCGYAITDRDQYPEVLARFWKELQRIDRVARTALTDEQGSSK